MTTRSHSASGFRITPLAFAALFIFSLLAPVVAFAAPAPTLYDLGQGLKYLRVTNLSEQLPTLRTALADNPAIVLDMRDVATNLTTAQTLRSALVPTAAKARLVRFILINNATASAIPFALGGGLPENSIPNVLIIAPEATPAPVDLKVSVSDDDDRIVCDALATGKNPNELVNRQPIKPRYDESVLVREHNGESTTTNDSDTDDSELKKTPLPPPPPDDLVLQTAVQVHRALLALKKL